jgi:D-sedoheptulose 7-phosphate isomerase
MENNSEVSFTQRHLTETAEIASQISADAIEKMIDILFEVRSNSGRLFIIGVGGSAANASHAVNDFRKLTNIESYAPTDNVSELTARTNDEGWSTVFKAWLTTSNLGEKDCLLILSVGGGNREKEISVNLCEAIDLAKSVSAKVLGIVGRNDGHTAQNANAVVVIPTVNPESVTPHSESFQEVIWHLMVSHPKLKMHQTKW